ncbi:hypothetical protein QX207_21435 [Vibrio vulnificus]|nr:hypothetical protein [Vibrio vulnificus]MDS1842198.1 hypothetical protein [Vibrio vulnificus]WMO06461.1 hypothetical protein NI378_07195 [Vibrio parahaemolyticus]
MKVVCGRLVWAAFTP